MLSDERPRFSIKDVGLVVGFTAAFVTQYLMLAKADEDMGKRLATVEASTNGKDIADMSARMTRLEMLTCVTDDAARARACQQLGVLK